MGGTGVASANYGSGVLINPALLAKAKPDDDITLIVPSIGAQISDKDDLRNKIDDISDDVNNYRRVLRTMNPVDLLNPIARHPGKFRSRRGFGGSALLVKGQDGER